MFPIFSYHITILNSTFSSSSKFFQTGANI